MPDQFVTGGPGPVQVAGRPLRILHVTDTFPPTPGGLERAVDAVTAGWVARGYAAAVVTARHPDAPAVEDRGGVTVWRVPVTLARFGVHADPGRVFLPPVPDPEFTRGVARAIAAHRPDVIHVHGWSLYSTLGPARRAGVPVVTTAHDHGQVCAAKVLAAAGRPCTAPTTGWCSCGPVALGPVKGRLVVAALAAAGFRHRHVAEHLAISAAVASAGSAMRRRWRRSMTVVPTFIAASLLDDAASAARPGWVPSGPYVFAAGAVTEAKGVDVAVAAAAAWWEDGQRVPLVVAGAPPTGSLPAHPPGSVVFVGARPHREVLGGWSHGTVGVVPTRIPEGLGQVAVEALAAGCPLVVSAAGGLVEVVDGGRFASLVPPGDPAALAAAVSGLLGDPAARARLTATGPAAAARFTLDVVAPQVEAVYRRVLAAAGRPAT